MTRQALSFELENATLAFDGQCAFEDVSMRVAAGETVALVGPSGAGKTSVLRLLNCMLLATSGCVRVQGEDLTSHTPRDLRTLRRRIATIPQGFGLVPNMRVAQNVLSGRVGQLGFWNSLRSVLHPSAQELEEIHALLEQLGIEDKLFQRADALSGGEQQRVAIARALYQKPDALLADEPLSALDPSRARETLELLTQLTHERGVTLVLSLHDILLAREWLPRLIGLRGGKVHFDSCTEAITDEAISGLYALGNSNSDHAS